MNRPNHIVTKKTLFESCRGKAKKMEPELQHLVIEGMITEPLGLNFHVATKNGFAKYLSEERELETRIKTCIRSITSNSTAIDHGVQAAVLTMQQIYNELKFITQRMQRDDLVQEAKTEWKYAAMVVDRLCLFIFSMVIVCCTCGIMFTAPHVVV